MTNRWRRLTMLGMLAFCWPVLGDEKVLPVRSEQSASQLLAQARNAYTIFDRTDLSRALLAKGVEVLPELVKALEDEHWHVRHCALMTLCELAKSEGNRMAIKPLVPNLADLLLRDPSIGVRVSVADCLGALGEQGKGAQAALAKASMRDSDPWVNASASAALTSVRGDLDIMMPVFGAMILSADKTFRAEGIKKAGQLNDQGVDVSPFVPALMDVFRKPIYDANFSGQTRVPAMNLLLKLKADTRELVPFIIQDLRTAWKLTEDGYHPYQKITLSILGRMGASAETALPVLEEVMADPSKFGCTPSHPDYKTFISLSKESIENIRAELEKKGAR